MAPQMSKLASRGSGVPHRAPEAWMFAKPDPVPLHLQHKPIDCVDWCAQFIDDPAALAAYGDVDKPKMSHIKHRRLVELANIDTSNPWSRLLLKYQIGTPTAVMFDMRNIIREYQLISMAHFANIIDVELVQDTSECNPRRTMHIAFIVGRGLHATDVPRLARVELDPCDIPTGMISVQEMVQGTKTWVSLQTSLSMNFPPNEALTSQDTMEAYWAANGKTFNWAGLPTELQLNVLQNCVSDICAYKDVFHNLPGAKKLSARAQQDRVRHRSEVVQKLGEWQSIMQVSKQFRALTLDLLFKGCNAYPLGFCVSAFSWNVFASRLRRLDTYSQMTQPWGVVKRGDRAGSGLAQQYNQFPKIYPQLDRFATFKHGIRKIYLEFDFMSYMWFFKVTAGGIHLERPKGCMTCDVFDLLPHLNQIVIALPIQYDSKKRYYGPMLVHDDEPCPRTLHRLIYEKVAVELAAYKNVEVHYFIDDDEKQRYTGMRQSAQLALKFSEDELVELYADDEGGIALSEDDLGTYYPQARSPSSRLLFHRHTLTLMQI